MSGRHAVVGSFLLAMAASPQEALGQCRTRTICVPGEPCDEVEICTLPPGAFSLVAPSTGSTGVIGAPALDWTDSSDATSYYVTVTAPGQTTPVLAKTTTASALTVPRGVLKPGITYTWNALAKNGAGTKAAANGPFTFSTRPVELDWSLRDRYRIGTDNLAVPVSPYDPSEVVLDACSADAYFPAGTLASYTFSLSVAGGATTTIAQSTSKSSMNQKPTAT